MDSTKEKNILLLCKSHDAVLPSLLQKFIGERSDIVQLAGKIGDGSASPSSERRIKFAEGTQTVSLQKHS